MCATLEIIDLARTAARGDEVTSCLWCGAARPGVSFEPETGLMFHCPACGVSFTWAFGRRGEAPCGP